MKSAYRKTELFNRPAVSEEDAARNKAAAQVWAKEGRRGNFAKPVRARPAQQGVFPVGKSTIEEWISAGILPPPKKVGRVVYWPAEAIHDALKKLGLQAPGEPQVSTEVATPSAQPSAGTPPSKARWQEALAAKKQAATATV